MAHEVFISYAAEDKRIADAVCNAIEASGTACWYAPRDVPYGQDFEESIVDAISASRLIILILTSHANRSTHVKREVQNACLEDVSVPVLPFRVEDVPLNKALRYYIGSVHWLDAVMPPLESHLQRLVEHVQARLPRPSETPTSEPERRTVPKPAAKVAEKSLHPDAEGEGLPSRVEENSKAAKVRATDADRAKPEVGPASKAVAANVSNLLLPAILVTLFCCLPAGIPAIVFAARANARIAAGNIHGAVADSKTARTWMFVSVGLGVMVWGYLVLVNVIGLLGRH